jgi:hypothetical protein
MMVQKTLRFSQTDLQNSFCRAALLSAPLIMLLSSCGGSGTGSQIKDGASEEQKHLENLTPGKYKMSMAVTKLEIPGLEAKDIASIKTELADAITSDVCLTAADLDPAKFSYHPVSGIISGLMGDAEAKLCTYQDFSTKNGNITGKVSCKSNSIAIQDGVITGSIKTEQTKMKIVGKVAYEDGEEPADIEIEVLATRTGSCVG